MITSVDKRYMAVAIRLARRNEGLTGTNPSVACLLVRDDGEGPFMVGSGITALGGRPHAEPLALAEAGAAARGATAYVTLEPCAHHGHTPPCAQTLIDAGVKRVVTAVVDPDQRVNQAGHAMLRKAGIEVETGCLAEEAMHDLRAYLTHKRFSRSHVTLKLAISEEGALGKRGGGQISITGEHSRAQTHLMRARHQAILVGAGTVREDNPGLTCRLPGLVARSPIRLILDPAGSTPLEAAVYQTARDIRTIVFASEQMPAHRKAALRQAGCEIMPCELQDEKVALPELLDDLGSIGIMSLMVEGGAAVANSFLEAGVVDELVLFEGAGKVEGGSRYMVLSPVTSADLPSGKWGEFDVVEQLQLGEDRMTRYTRR